MAARSKSDEDSQKSSRPAKGASGKAGRSRPERAGKDGPRETIDLRNPHAALAVLKRRPQEAKSLTLRGGGPAWKPVLEAAEAAGVRVIAEPDKRHKYGPRGGERNTGASLLVTPPPSLPLGQVLSSDQGESATGLWLALEHVQDPRNLGAIFRSAAFFGVRGVILTKDRSASLTGIACDTAAGGAETVPHAVVTNFARSLDAAKEAGLWILGTSEHSDQPLESVEADRNWLLVVGNEEHGLRRLTKERCDVLTGISCLGGVGSLNVSVATGVCTHWLTRRGAADGEA